MKATHWIAVCIVVLMALAFGQTRRRFGRLSRLVLCMLAGGAYLGHHHARTSLDLQSTVDLKGPARDNAVTFAQP